MTFKEKIQFTLRIRLFLLLIILVATLLMGLIVILLTTGNITVGLSESEDFIKNEHSHISSQVVEYYENIAAEAVGFSRSLSLNIESKLKEKGLHINDIKDKPQLLDSIISDELNQILLYLNKSKSSGAFIILDATVNNKLPGSDKSKAGLYLKNMEPNIINSTSPTIYVLRGSQKIAYRNNIPLHPEWKMEFNVNDASYYNLPIEKASKNKDSLSKLYYWSPAFTLPGTSEEIMICSVPLIDSEGNVFGVCGLDVSAMLFKLSFIPNSSMYQRIFYMISPITENTVKSNQSMFSGGYNAISSLNTEDLTILKGNKLLNNYRNSETDYMGYHDYIKMYPEESVFLNDEWILALMIPREDIQNYAVKANTKLLAICLSFIIIGLITSLILSRFYIKPIYIAISALKDNPHSDIKTNIFEIDELMEHLLIREVKENKKESDSHSIILNEFLNNFKTLSPAERSVFNLYAQEYSAKEIADKLCLSINTIKTHTKHIYSKLNVKSKEELLLYVDILKESGKSFN